MATIKKTAAKKQLLDDDQIIKLYMTDVLENNHVAANVYLFCKNNNIEETEFYTFFSSFKSVRQTIWVRFFENALSIIEKDAAYNTYSDKNKLLAFYFTLFEILTLNRSYVMFSMKENDNGLKNLEDLKHFRNRFKDFVAKLIHSTDETKPAALSKITKPVFSEGAWLQFLFLLKFWMDDTSKGFEKTDIAIEKSVNTVVDLLDTKPLENLIDLGKFLWNERRA
jgi:hypothetical protein